MRVKPSYASVTFAVVDRVFTRKNTPGTPAPGGPGAQVGFLRVPNHLTHPGSNFKAPVFCLPSITPYCQAFPAGLITLSGGHQLRCLDPWIHQSRSMDPSLWGHRYPEAHAEAAPTSKLAPSPTIEYGPGGYLGLLYTTIYYAYYYVLLCTTIHSVPP